MRGTTEGTEYTERKKRKKTLITKARKDESTKKAGLIGYRFEHLSADVIGAALAVHRELGPGFLESIYHAAMRVALTHRAIPFESQHAIDISFEGVVVGQPESISLSPIKSLLN